MSKCRYLIGEMETPLRFYRSKTDAWLARGVDERLGLPARYADAELRPIGCSTPSRMFTNDPAQFGRLLDWAEGKYYDDLKLIGQPF